MNENAQLLITIIASYKITNTGTQDIVKKKEVMTSDQ